MLKKTKLETLDEALFIWFRAERGRGLPISGPTIQQKALRLNANLPHGDPNFTVSQEWLNRWKNRPWCAFKNIKKNKKTALLDLD